MSYNITKLSIIVAISLCGSNLMAGSITVPNTFVGGTPATASEVNANFSAIKSAVDDNDSRITTNAGDISANTSNITANTNAINSLGSLSVFVNGVRIGALLEFQFQERSGGMQEPVITVFNNSGYTAGINHDGDGLLYRQITFTTSDCTGQAYVINYLGREGDFMLRNGEIFSAVDKDVSYAYYTQNGSITESAHFLSFIQVDTGACFASDYGTPIPAYKIYPNNPNVTGFSNSDFVGAVTIGY